MAESSVPVPIAIATTPISAGGHNKVNKPRKSRFVVYKETGKMNKDGTKPKFKIVGGSYNGNPSQAARKAFNRKYVNSKSFIMRKTSSNKYYYFTGKPGALLDTPLQRKLPNGTFYTIKRKAAKIKLNKKVVGSIFRKKRTKK